MGGFHIAINYIAVVGKMFRDSGLLDLIIKSDIYGCSTASHLLKRKTHNRGVTNLSWKLHPGYNIKNCVSGFQLPEIIYIYPIRRVSQRLAVEAVSENSSES